MNMNAGYSFGDFGIGISAGYFSSETDQTKVNEFIASTGASPDQMMVSHSKQQNMFFLAGPTAQFGKNIKTILHVSGGLFLNNSGYVNIYRRGAVTSAYRNEPSSKNLFPGFSAGANLNFPVSPILSVGFSTEYMNTKSEVMNYDARRGAAIEGLKLSKNISNLLAGITLRYNINTARETASGKATGRTAREVQSGQATGKNQAQYNPKEYSFAKTYQPGKPV